MNISYDGQIFGWQRYGGISRLFSKLISKINSYDFVKVEILGNFHKCEYFTEEEKSIYKNSIYLKKGIEIPGKILQIVNRPRLKIDTNIYHETYYDSFSAKLSKNTKRVITVFDLIQERFPEYNVLGNDILKAKEKSIRRADHIISISNSTKIDLIDIYNIHPEKISVVHLGNELSTISYNEKRLIEDDYILYVGNRKKYKNFISLVKAIHFSDLKNIKIIAFGGEKISKKELEKYKNYNIDIKYHSGDDKVLLNLYNHAMAFVLTSFYEGFGIPPLEAMNNGCPTICSNTSSIPEVVGEASLLFDPSDIESLIIQLNKLAFDSSLRDEIIELGYLRSRNFSWDKCTKETLEVYKKIN
jgi:glycosyltransferase involved in cell wall biosynthesis